MSVPIAILINPIRWISTKLSTWWKLRDYRKMHKVGQAVALWLWLLSEQTPDEQQLWRNTDPHPSYEERLVDYRDAIENNLDEDWSCIAFGNSLKDIPRKDFLTVPEYANFSISGSRSHNMLRMARVIHAILEQNGKLDEVKYVFVGTLEGNGFLVGMPYKQAIDRAIAALDEIRELFPNARIIVDSIPPTYSVAANVGRWPYEYALIDWVNRDRDAVLISFKKMGMWFPGVWLSSDGVHHTPAGTRRFDFAMGESIMANRGEVIYA